jgi:DNA-binding response OmpR family regulator
MPVELSMSILVVEDSRTMGQFVRNHLTLMGFRHVDTVSTAPLRSANFVKNTMNL